MLKEPFDFSRKIIYVALTLLFIILIGGAMWVFRYQVNLIRENKYAEIRAIAHLKSDEIVRWLGERYSDVDYFARSMELKSILLEKDKGTKDSILQKEFNRVFQRMRKNHHYANVRVVDLKGNTLYSFNGFHQANPGILTIVSDVGKKQKIVLHDFSINPENQLIHLDIAAPVQIGNSNRAVLIFTIDPSTFLYPLIQSWPAPSKTSETLLLRREGDSILYLNELKHAPKAALRLKQPLSEESLPPLDAVNGKLESFEGKDYDGKSVIADIRPIRGTPWLMIAKIDKSEVFYELKFRIILQAGMLLMLLMFIASLAALLYSRRQKSIYEQMLTNRKEADEQIRKLNTELELRVEERTEQLIKTNKDLEAFTYSVSHDLRTPLRAIDGYSAMLELDYKNALDAEGHRLIHIVRQNAQKMGVLIDELLTFSRLGRASMNLIPVDMKAIVMDAVDELTQQDKGKSRKVIIGDLHPAKADPAMMKQVWLNLISNAFKFTRGKEGIVISISSGKETGRIVYSIQDNGAGFDMKYYDKLFGVFQRLHSEKEFEGTGVGLAIVQQVIIRHGGSIWADSKIGEGATFCFSLPEY
jgi:signal transduction histidine kinase